MEPNEHANPHAPSGYRCRRRDFAQAGWALRELLVVLGILAVLLVVVSMILPSFSRACCKAQRISCVNNLKLIGTAYRVWAGDNNDRMPWNASITNGGWNELAFGPNAGRYCWTNYAIMANELGQSSRVVICPTDIRDAATNFEVMKDNRAISYFVGINSSDVRPQSILGGDRNIGPGTTPMDDYGYSPDSFLGNSVVIHTNSRVTPITWSRKMHSLNGEGDLLMGDGSVIQASGARLRSDYQPYAGVPRSREIESTNTHARPYTDFPTFRLVFP